MGRYREETSAFFTRLVYDFGGKWRLPTFPLSKSLASPAPQTSLSTSSHFIPLDRMSNVNSFHSIFRSFRPPRRAHPFDSLSHLPGPAVYRSLRTVPRSVFHEDQRLPRPAGTVFTIVKHDMQSDAIQIAFMGMGTCQVPQVGPTLVFNGWLSGGI